MPRRNRSNSRPNRRHYASPLHVPRSARSPAHTRIDTLVLPDGKCGRKLRWGTEAKAQAALDETKVQRSSQHGGKNETRYYSCQRCQGFHLTSREEAPQ